MWRTTKAYPAHGPVSVISIHVLRVEDDLCAPSIGAALYGFQSTSSVWRTTYQPGNSALLPTISIHVLRVEDDYRFALLQFSAVFQSTSSVWRTTTTQHVRKFARLIFQSTSSVWRTTFRQNATVNLLHISIHVLRVEDDSCAVIYCHHHSISIHVLRVEDDATTPRQSRP